MKRFLSLVLTLVMVMSLVTVSAGAKEFTDGDTITYQEAVDVISTIGVVDGDVDGSFRPTDVLTRQAAAKIICNLILGPTTAAELHADTAPYSDVPTTSQFAGYIAYCAKEGIISGYGNGTFRPTAPLTGYAFMKMLLGALGYDANYEQYVGNNWSINVAKQAIGIGLNNSLVDEFNGLKSVTREEACLYAFNTLMATTVGYEQKITTTVNGVDVTISNGAAKVVYWTEGTTRNDHIKNDGLVQFAEEYFGKLYLTKDVTVFGQPDREWEFEGKEIGTYVNTDLLDHEYTAKVTGKDLYDELGKNVIDDYALLVTIDGQDDVKQNSNIFTAADLYRANTDKIGATGKGVLTQVFVNPDKDEYGGKTVFVAIINTYLAKAIEDYDEKNDDIDLHVFDLMNVGSQNRPEYQKGKPTSTLRVTADGEDFDIKDITKDELFLVTVADGEIQSMMEPEILSESSITSFKKTDWVKSEGTQYDYADTALYDEEVLDEYDQTNMKDVSYNIILDEYGYLIGLELNEDPDQYVFLTGIDANTSNLSVKTADANIIHLDGTMETVTVDMTKSKDGDGNSLWDYLRNTFSGNQSQVNTWCKYSVASNGNYTLKQIPVSTTSSKIAPKVKVAQYAQDVSSSNYVGNDQNGTGTVKPTKTISEKRVSLLSFYDTTNGYKGYVYGNDSTVYINAEMENVLVTHTAGGRCRQIIDDVESVTTGVKNVELVMTDLGVQTGKDGQIYLPPEAEIYTLYKNTGNIIATLTIGENQGSASKFAYIISDDVSQEDLGDTTGEAKATGDGSEWTWHRKAVVDGKITYLTEVNDSIQHIGASQMKAGQWYELRYDSKGNVRKSEDLTAKLKDDVTNDKYINSAEFVEAALNNNNNTVLLWDTVTVGAVNQKELKFVDSDGTLWLDEDQHRGISVDPEVQVVLCLADSKAKPFDENEDGYVGYSGLAQAITDMNAFHTSHTVLQGEVEVSAIMSPSAKIIVINDKTPSMKKNPNAGSGDTATLGDPIIDYDLRTVSVNVLADIGAQAMAQAEFRTALANVEGGVLWITKAGTTSDTTYWNIVTREGAFTGISRAKYLVAVNGEAKQYVKATDAERLSSAIKIADAGTTTAGATGYLVKSRNNASDSWDDGIFYQNHQSAFAKGMLIAKHYDAITGYVSVDLASTTADVADAMNGYATVSAFALDPDMYTTVQNSSGTNIGVIKAGGSIKANATLTNTQAEEVIVTLKAQVATLKADGTYNTPEWKTMGSVTLAKSAANVNASFTLSGVKGDVLDYKLEASKNAPMIKVASSSIVTPGNVDVTDFYNFYGVQIKASFASHSAAEKGKQIGTLSVTLKGDGSCTKSITLTLSDKAGGGDSVFAWVSGNDWPGEISRTGNVITIAAGLNTATAESITLTATYLAGSADGQPVLTIAQS